MQHVVKSQSKKICCAVVVPALSYQIYMNVSAYTNFMKLTVAEHCLLERLCPQVHHHSQIGQGVSEEIYIINRQYILHR